MTGPAEFAGEAAPAPDGVSVGRWFAFYGLLLAATGGLLVLLLAREPWAWGDWLDRPAELLPGTAPAGKLLAFGIYISLCCTFLPLPANWIVAAVAMRQTAVADNVWATALLVAAAGALASTLANLNDYHLFTWLLRHHRIRKVRRTRLYHASARWFARSPFFILVVFNVIPIPVDVIRMLATTYRYARGPFAAANFVGRFLRYGVIAWGTYRLGSEGKWAVLVLLALAVVLAAGKFLPAAVRKFRPKAPNGKAREVSTGS